MKKFFMILASIATVFSFTPTEQADAASWSASFTNVNSSWWIAEGGFGNASYNLYLTETHNYTYRREVTFHEAWALNRNYYNYRVEIQHANRYYQNSTYLNAVGYHEWSRSIARGIIHDADEDATGGANGKDIVGNPGVSTINVQSTSQAYVTVDNHSVYGDAEKRSKNLP